MLSKMGRIKSNKGYRPSKLTNKQLSKFMLPGLSRPSVPAQRTEIQWIKLPAVQVASSSGSIATVNAPSLSLAQNIASLKACYDEFRILAIRWDIQCTTNQSGCTVFYVDETDTSNPTLATASNRIGRLVPNSINNTKSVFNMQFRCQNLPDLNFVEMATGTALQVCSLKIYTDGANYNTYASAATVWLLEPKLLVEFRGQGGP